MMDLGQDSPMLCLHSPYSLASARLGVSPRGSIIDSQSGDASRVNCSAPKLSYLRRGTERYQMSQNFIKSFPVDVFVGPSTNCGRVGTLLSP